MEIRQLEYFLAVKNAGSFTRAAEHLYVSQPAVTSAIRSLESELGTTLFDRSQGKASLTAEGRIFSAHVEEIMKGVVTTIRDMDAMKSLSSGTLAIGISSFLSLPSVLSLIARFLSDHPGIECRVQEGPAEAVAALLEKGELDGAFLPAKEKETYKPPAKELEENAELIKIIRGRLRQQASAIEKAMQNAREEAISPDNNPHP